MATLDPNLRELQNYYDRKHQGYAAECDAKPKCPACGRAHLSEAGKCWMCGYETEAQVESEIVEDGTLVIESNGKSVTTTLGKLEEVAEALESGAVAVDPETGEVQRTLNDSVFAAIPRRSVPTHKISFSGTVELTAEEFAEYFSKPLKPGVQVSLRVAGYIPAPHAKWVKRSQTDEYTGEKEVFWEREGAVGIKVTDMGEPELGGEWHDE